MRAHLVHIEPLRTSGLEKGLKLRGRVIVEIRFGADGKVDCVRVKSGHPIAAAAAIEAVPKWTFRPVVLDGPRTGGCGSLSISYQLGDQGNWTKVREE